MLIQIHPGSGVPIYLQIVQQLTHSIEIGALRPGEQLPTIRALAQDLVTNPNTVAKAYHELEYHGVIELRQGIGAFVPSDIQPAAQAEAVKHVKRLMADALANMHKLSLSQAAIRRVFEAALTQEQESPAKLSHGTWMMSSARAIMSVQGLRERLGTIDAADSPDSTVPQTCVCGFWGGNGAG